MGLLHVVSAGLIQPKMIRNSQQTTLLGLYTIFLGLVVFCFGIFWQLCIPGCLLNLAKTSKDINIIWVSPCSMVLLENVL